MRDRSSESSVGFCCGREREVMACARRGFDAVVDCTVVFAGRGASGVAGGAGRIGVGVSGGSAGGLVLGT